MASWNKGFLKAPKQKEEQPNLEFGGKKPHLESSPETQGKLKKSPKMTKVREVSESGFEKEINANKLETMIENLRSEVIQLKKKIQSLENSWSTKSLKWTKGQKCMKENTKECDTVRRSKTRQQKKSRSRFSIKKYRNNNKMRQKWKLKIMSLMTSRNQSKLQDPGKNATIVRANRIFIGTTLNSIISSSHIGKNKLVEQSVCFAIEKGKSSSSRMAWKTETCSETIGKIQNKTNIQIIGEEIGE